MFAFGRDRRRRLSRQEAAELFAAADGRCQRCGSALGVEWHQAHLIAHTNGGATQLANMQAWCRDCNLLQGATNAADPTLPTPREWQTQAMDAILARIWQDGTATVHAAPGAGKTFFAGLVFRRLRAAGLVDRMVVVVPNRALQRQWSEALGGLQIHLDWEPRDGFFELSGTVGAVTTYQSLANSAAGHMQRMRDSRTLLILDEVHHVGDQKSWGQAVSRIVGAPDVDDGVLPAGVLNMTGTLFRSSGDQKIGTVRYDKKIIDGVEKFEAVADYSVPAFTLIGVELRRPDLYAYDGNVELIDIRSENALRGDIADLESGSQVNTAIRQGFLRRALVQAFAQEALKMLSQQLATIDNREPLKLLWVAEDQKSARIAAEEIDKAANRPGFARLIISDNKDALAELRRAAADRKSCAIVAVRMVTEGFDCPQVSAIAYASAITAPLFLAQMMARAMRVTAFERADKMMLPAQILIPNNPTLRSAFTDALIGHFHILDVPDDDAPARLDRPGHEAPLRLPRYQLTDMSTLGLHSATVLGETDGVVMAGELEEGLAECLELGIPAPYAPRVVVASRRLTQNRPLYTVADAAPTSRVGLVVEPADPRSVNRARRTRIDAVAKWMHHHLTHDSHWESIGEFQGKANAAGDLGRGGRDNATPRQLELVEGWMLARAREHCDRNRQCVLPSTIRSED